jgi:hypothetical protein
MAKEPAYKPIKFRPAKWQEIQDLADELSAERGSSVYLPDTVSEAIKFYRENRKKESV